MIESEGGKEGRKEKKYKEQRKKSYAR